MTGYIAPSLPRPRYLQPKHTYMISFHHTLGVKAHNIPHCLLFVV